MITSKVMFQMFISFLLKCQIIYRKLFKLSIVLLLPKGSVIQQLVIYVGLDYPNIAQGLGCFFFFFLKYYSTLDLVKINYLFLMSFIFVYICILFSFLEHNVLLFLLLVLSLKLKAFILILSFLL